MAGVVANLWEERRIRLVIAIVETTMPEHIETYTERLRTEWGTHRPLSDGEEEIFIVVAATDRTLRIAAGIRMTSIVERALQNRLMVDVGPLLRSKKYFQGIMLIVDSLSQATRSGSYVKSKVCILRCELPFVG